MDNDAGGITTYSLAGAQFGLRLIWSLIPIMISLIVVQEMCSRMGVVTGKGLSDLIREKFGAKITFYLMIGMFLTNMGNVISEFAGVAAGMEIFGVSKYISVPISAVLVWGIVVKGTYQSVEKIFLVACVFYLAYIVTGVIVQPDWGEVLAAFVPRHDPGAGRDDDDHRPGGDHHRPLDAVLPAGLDRREGHPHRGVPVRPAGTSSSGRSASTWSPSSSSWSARKRCTRRGSRSKPPRTPRWPSSRWPGSYCTWLFAFGLVNASLFSASILPLSTTYLICEGLGWETGIDKKFVEAPEFYGFYSLMIFLGAGIILLPDMPLIAIMYVSQVVNGVVLPLVLIFMLLLVNDRTLMREHTNGPVFNIVAWLTVVVMIVLTGILLVKSVVGAVTGGHMLSEGRAARKASSGAAGVGDRLKLGRHEAGEEAAPARQRARRSRARRCGRS